jgi:hypothetical protein
MGASLQKFIGPAGADSVLLLGGIGISSVANYIKSSLNFDRIHSVVLTSETMQSTQLADKIRSASSLLVSGLTATEISLLFASPSPVQSALILSSQDPTNRLFFAGEAIALCGSRRIANPEIAETDLIYGKLSVAAGLNIMPFSVCMGKLFSSDDFIENRVGGWEWLMHTLPGGIGLGLDSGSSLIWSTNQLVPDSRQPALLVDLKKVTLTDSSDYRHRTTANLRQSSAFYGGILHCWSNLDNYAYDIEKQTWNQNTGVMAPAIQGHTIPVDLQLDAFPNPSPSTLTFNLNTSMQKESHSLKIFNLRGELVAEIAANIGKHSFTWDAIDRNGRPVPTGVYYAMLLNDDDRFLSTFTILR